MKMATDLNPVVEYHGCIYLLSVDWNTSTV